MTMLIVYLKNAKEAFWLTSKVLEYADDTCPLIIKVIYANIMCNMMMYMYPD